MEKKTVPLVVYRSGERIVIGTTVIHEDGTFEVRIDDTEQAREVLPKIRVGEVSIRSASPTERFLHETAFPTIDGFMDGLAGRESALSEMDRNARAYGWEVGRGKPLGKDIAEVSPDNPFIHSDWRSRLTPDDPAKPKET